MGTASAYRYYQDRNTGHPAAAADLLGQLRNAERNCGGVPYAISLALAIVVESCDRSRAPSPPGGARAPRSWSNCGGFHAAPRW